MGKISPVDDYIRQFPGPIRTILTELRATIRGAAPEATEKISYGMPTFYFHGNLVHFAACKNHIGFYPTASGIAKFAPELKDYKTSKGAVQFPLDRPLPSKMIGKIVEFRVRENRQMAGRKRKP